MCEPATLAAISLATTVAGAGLQAVGQNQAAQAQADAAQYRAQVAENNRIIANVAASDELAVGRVEEEQARIRTAQLVGRQRTSFASQGVLVDDDSAAQSVADTRVLGDLDALTIRANAERRAVARQQQAEGFQQEATLLDFQARNTRAAGRSAMFGTLLSGAGSVASKWYDFNQSGAL